MSKTGVISASLRTEPRSAQAANSQPKPNDAFVHLQDFVFGDDENLASLKLHYLTLGTPRRDPSGAIDRVGLAANFRFLVAPRRSAEGIRCRIW